MIEKLYVVFDRDGNPFDTNGRLVAYLDQERAMGEAAAVGGGSAETFVRDPKGQMKHVASMDMWGLRWQEKPTKRQRSKMARLLLKIFDLEDAL